MWQHFAASATTDYEASLPKLAVLNQRPNHPMMSDAALYVQLSRREIGSRCMTVFVGIPISPPIGDDVRSLAKNHRSMGERPRSAVSGSWERYRPRANVGVQFRSSAASSSSPSGSESITSLSEDSTVSVRP